MISYQSFKEAVLYVQNQPYQDPSVINSSIISAVDGEHGNFHLTAKTKGSRLSISALMAQFWFFDLTQVASQNLYLPLIRNTVTFWETLHTYMAVRVNLDKREDQSTFRL